MGKVTGEMQMNITVYLGANEGSDPALKQAVEGTGPLGRRERERAGLRRLPQRPDGASGPQRSDGGR